MLFDLQLPPAVFTEVSFAFICCFWLIIEQHKHLGPRLLPMKLEQGRVWLVLGRRARAFRLNSLSFKVGALLAITLRIGTSSSFHVSERDRVRLNDWQASVASLNPAPNVAIQGVTKVRESSLSLLYSKQRGKCMRGSIIALTI